MNLEKRFLRVYAVMVVCVSFVILTGLALHQHWLTDVAGILLGLTIQVLILAVSGLALRGQALNHRPRAAKILLVIIISAVILSIFAFQLNRAADCLHEYAQRNR
jgi:hypothetical protein